MLVREKRYTRYQIAENLEMDTSRWPQMSDREFLAAVMEAATGLPRWDDGTDPKTTPPQPVKDAPTDRSGGHRAERTEQLLSDRPEPVGLHSEPIASENTAQLENAARYRWPSRARPERPSAGC